MRAGKIRYIGCSNFSGWHLMKSLAVSDRYGWPRYVAHQAYYSLIGRDYEWELMPLGARPEGRRASSGARSAGAGSPARSAAASRCPQTSRLHSKIATDIGPPVADEYLYRVVDALDAVAKETGKTVPQVALNWLLQRPTVANVIIGARNEEQLRQNLGAVGWKLTAEQVAELDAASAVPLAYPYWHQRQTSPSGIRFHKLQDCRIAERIAESENFVRSFPAILQPAICFLAFPSCPSCLSRPFCLY